MFRAILSQTPKTLNTSVFRSGFATEQPRRRFLDINEVKLVGTLINDTYVLPSGKNALTVRTNTTGDKYQNHKVYTNKKTDLKAGQRIHVSGLLSSRPFTVENEKQLNGLSIQANRIFVLDEQQENENKDRNEIELLGNVCNNILDKGTHAIFSVATHYNKRYNTDAERDEEGQAENKPYGANFQTVFVWDEKLIEIARKLAKSDRVLINGMVKYTTNTDTEGTKKYAGFIVANGIEKVARRKQQIVEETDIENESKN